MEKQNEKMITTNTNVVEPTEKIKLYNLEMDEFKKIKTAPKNRWFHSSMAFLIAAIFVLLGVLSICLIIMFA